MKTFLLMLAAAAHTVLWIPSCAVFWIPAYAGNAALAAEAPYAPRLAAARGVVAGGFQTSSGGEGAFSLFAAKTNGDDLRRIGQFHGRLAGVALDDAGNVLALTNDGALGRYGDDVDPLAEPDSRWNMSALFWLDGAPLALTNDNGSLHAVRPSAAGEWIRDDRPIAEIPVTSRIDGLALPDGLHLLILPFGDDLSTGAARHLLLEKNVWRELPPLPVGDAAVIAPVPAELPRGLFSGSGTPGTAIAPGILSLRRDPFSPDPPGRAALSFHAWRGTTWTRLPMPEGFESALRNSRCFTAAGDAPDEAIWLITGDGGAFLVPAGKSPGETLIRVGEGTGGAGAAPSGNWDGWSGFLTLAGLLALVVVYCRRSRALSQTLFGRPPDLFSRGAALAADWFTVSFLMAGCHFANGDINILPRLLNLEDVQTIFWINLAGLTAYMTAFEILFGFTPGKYFAGIRVRSIAGGKPAFLQMILRNLLRAVDMFPLPIGFPGLVGAAATFFGARRQRIGDRCAGTVVLRHRPLRQRSFLLASASPRRLELLNVLGLAVRAEATNTDEAVLENEDPPDAVCRLSQQKARAAENLARQGEIVIAADTVVVLGDTILGKPKSREEAKQMLAGLSGRSHTVWTGVTVWDTATGQGITECEETEVEFRTLSDFEISAYVATGEPMDKAGGYGVQSGHLIKQVRGSLSNVIGLPMEKLQNILNMLDS